MSKKNQAVKRRLSRPLGIGKDSRSFRKPRAESGDGRSAARQRTPTVRVNSAFAIDIGSLPIKQNLFKVVIHTDGHTFFSSLSNQQLFIKYGHPVLKQIDPTWAEIDWPPDTTIPDVVKAMNARFNAYCKQNKGVHLFNWIQRENYMYRRHTQTEPLGLYRECGETMGAQPEAACIWELKTYDLKLYKIVLAVLGNMLIRTGLGNWIDNSEIAIDHIQNIIDDGREDESDLEEYRNCLAFFQTGDPVSLVNDMELYLFGRETVTRWVRAYKWDSYFKKRILVWIRTADRLYRSEFKSLGRYCNWGDMNGDYAMPNHYLYWKWSYDSTIVDQITLDNDNSTFNEVELMPLTCKVSTDKTEWKSVELFYSWMVYSAFIFDKGLIPFLKHGKTKKLAKKVYK